MGIGERVEESREEVMKLKSPATRRGCWAKVESREGSERRRGSCSEVELGKWVRRIEKGVLRKEKEACRRWCVSECVWRKRMCFV